MQQHANVETVDVVLADEHNCEGEAAVSELQSTDFTFRLGLNDFDFTADVLQLLEEVVGTEDKAGSLLAFDGHM